MIISRAQRYDDPAELEKVKERILNKLKNSGQGAANTVWGAVGKVWEGKGGVYLEDMAPAEVAGDRDLRDGGYAEFAFDEEAEKKLWEMSCEMVGQKTVL